MLAASLLSPATLQARSIHPMFLLCCPVCVAAAGATSIALVPTLQYHPPAPASSLPALPHELLALCMLRVLQRKNHHSGLDSSNSMLCDVVALFGSFYQGQTQQQLVNQLTACFDHVVPMVVGRVDAQHQVGVFGVSGGRV
jgi:hypothetical protein